MSKKEKKPLTAAQKAMGPAYMAKLTITLLVITAIVALGLGLVNGITEDQIAAVKLEKTNAALAAVMTDADNFVETDYTGDGVSMIREATSGGELVGYCVTAVPGGFGGTVEMVVGVDLDGNVTGITVVKHTETAGLGPKAMTPEFLSQYLGKGGSFAIKEGENAIIPISGVTVTSTAVTKGVNSALAAVAPILEGGSSN